MGNKIHRFYLKFPDQRQAPECTQYKHTWLGKTNIGKIHITHKIKQRGIKGWKIT